MAEAMKLAAKRREKVGSRSARKLRQQGFLPAVVYGHKEETISIAISDEEFHRALRHHTRIVDLETDGKTEKALIREVQWDYLGQDVLHVDFARVSAEERITVEVPLEFRGTAAGVEAGGIFEHPLALLEVECPAMSVPESIRVNIGHLQIDSAIYVKDLQLPEGVAAVTEPDTLVARVVAVGEEPEEAAAGEQAEPEVIKREREAEEKGE